MIFREIQRINSNLNIQPNIELARSGSINASDLREGQVRLLSF